MPGWIGPWELAVVLVVVLIIFGPKRVPQAGRSVGRGFREFKNAITGKDEDEKKAVSPTALAVTDEPASATARKRDTAK